MHVGFPLFGPAVDTEAPVEEPRPGETLQATRPAAALARCGSSPSELTPRIRPRGQAGARTADTLRRT
jgi:hypothetical protein